MARKSAPEEWGTYARELGLQLQRIRADVGLTQEQVASAAGLARSHYQFLERGLSRLGEPANPTLLSLVAVAQSLGVELGDVLPQEVPDLRAGE